jgi:hypothetical protein
MGLKSEIVKIVSLEHDLQLKNLRGANFKLGCAKILFLR